VNESPQEAYDRGTVAGGIAERLAGHDRHFAAINGQLARIAEEIYGMRLAVQGLSDAATSDRSTVVTTAAALKSADDARRSRSEWAWTPLARLSLAAGVLASGATIVFLILRPT
jgi:hypothetical protein